MHQSIGAVMDKLIWFGFGIYFIVLSIKKREKLGNKAAFIRFAGILFIFIGLLSAIMSIIKSR
ncbi:MAG: hypothetical protein PHQ96_05260 [Candidatus Omnitrophica bacterium]|nr:hypothetical protein [Candidatus Omnitrophota bacterium]